MSAKSFYDELYHLLSWLFQDGIKKYNIQILDDGYVLIDDLLTLNRFKKYVCEDFAYISWCREGYEFKEELSKYYIKKIEICTD